MRKFSKNVSEKTMTNDGETRAEKARSRLGCKDQKLITPTADPSRQNPLKKKPDPNLSPSKIAGQRETTRPEMRQKNGKKKGFLPSKPKQTQHT